VCGSILGNLSLSFVTFWELQNSNSKIQCLLPLKVCRLGYPGCGPPGVPQLAHLRVGTPPEFSNLGKFDNFRAFWTPKAKAMRDYLWGRSEKKKSAPRGTKMTPRTRRCADSTSGPRGRQKSRRSGIWPKKRPRSPTSCRRRGQKSAVRARGAISGDPGGQKPAPAGTPPNPEDHFRPARTAFFFFGSTPEVIAHSFRLRRSKSARIIKFVQI